MAPRGALNLLLCVRTNDKAHGSRKKELVLLMLLKIGAGKCVQNWGSGKWEYTAAVQQNALVHAKNEIGVICVLMRRWKMEKEKRRGP